MHEEKLQKVKQSMGNINQKKEKPLFIANLTRKRVLGTIAGNLLMAFGVAVLRVSHLGNDSFTAMNMAVSDLLPIGLGLYQIFLNLIFFLVELGFGRKYIGIGTLFNMFINGYVIQYSIPLIESVIGKEGSHPLGLQLCILFAGLLVVSLGLAFYQAADVGVAPYDYFSLGMTDLKKLPYFANRMITDCTCVIIALLTWILGFHKLSECHLGIGTILMAFCLGPFIAMFDKLFVGKLMREQK